MSELHFNIPKTWHQPHYNPAPALPLTTYLPLWTQLPAMFLNPSAKLFYCHCTLICITSQSHSITTLRKWHQNAHYRPTLPQIEETKFCWFCFPIFPLRICSSQLYYLCTVYQYHGIHSSTIEQFHLLMPLF